jgi:DNA polymerase lambda
VEFIDAIDHEFFRLMSTSQFSQTPPKRMRKSLESSTDKTNKIFENINFSLVPLGSLKGEVRRGIIRDRLLENGAHEIPSSDMIVLADLMVPLDKLMDYSSCEKIYSNFVDVSWVSDSIKANKKLDLKNYLVREEVQPPAPSEIHSPPATAVESDKDYNEGLACMFDDLDTMVSTSKDKRDSFRAMAYRKAASAIRSFARPIRTPQDAEELRSVIGERNLEKIKEFIETGKIKKAEYLKDEPKIAIRNTLMHVWGIGPSKADELISQGVTCIDQLRQNPSILNNNQKLGLMYYEDLLQKMPRAEIDEITEVIRGSICQLFGQATPSELICIPCGSYRRGLPLCSDADYLLYWDSPRDPHPSRSDTLERLVTDLTEKGYMVANFNRGWGEHSIYLGIIRIHPEKPARRIDLKIWPKESLPFALLHFTGNADFNRKIRLHAKRKGYKLTDWSLTNPDGEHVKCQSEQDVFAALGLEYIPPEGRTSSVELVEIRVESDRLDS